MMARKNNAKLTPFVRFLLKGADTLKGEDGNDILLGDHALAVVDSYDHTSDGSLLAAITHTPDGSGGLEHSYQLDIGVTPSPAVGGEGTDVVFGEGGNDLIEGGDHDDILVGWGGEDLLLDGASDGFMQWWKFNRQTNQPVTRLYN